MNKKVAGGWTQTGHSTLVISMPQHASHPRRPFPEGRPDPPNEAAKTRSPQIRGLCLCVRMALVRLVLPNHNSSVIRHQLSENGTCHNNNHNIFLLGPMCTQTRGYTRMLICLLQLQPSHPHNCLLRYIKTNSWINDVNKYS